MKRALTLLVAGAALGTAVGLSSPASADVVDGWDFNLANGNGLPGNTFTGASDIDSLTQLTLGGGDSVIDQTFVNGVASGAFTETGVVQILSTVNTSSATNFLTTGPLTGNIGGLGSAEGLYFSFSFSGTVGPGGTLTFNPGGTANLELSSSTTVNPLNPTVPGTTFTLATFNNVPGTGGTGLISAGGIPSGTIQLNFAMNTALSPISQLFTLNGKDLDSLALEFTNIQPVLAGSGTPNEVCDNSTSPPTCVVNPDVSGLDANGNGTGQIFVTDQGQVQLSVPEPGTLAIFGAGLGILGLLSWRRNRSQVQL